MSGLVLLEPINLYNMLQQASVYSCLSDPNFLLLIDARKTAEYNESHVITAKRAPKNSNNQFMLPYDAELECKQNIVVYDSNSASLFGRGEAVEYSNLLWDSGSRNPVKILKGGYEEFSALYPFLRTQKIIYMPRELDALMPYPTEIISGFLYLGNWRQANTPYVQKDLKIKAFINCTTRTQMITSTLKKDILHISVEDHPEVDFFSKFTSACKFIDDHRELKMAVLVFSDLGTSRCATIVMAYLMHTNKWTLQEAYDHVKKCNRMVRPLRSFVRQLSNWEKQIFRQCLTDISDPNF